MRMSDAHTIATSASGRELMMRAGRAIFENVEWKPPVAIVCGTGNNAGDGYVLAKLLLDAGIPCTVILLEEKFSPDGKYYFDTLGTGSVVHFEEEMNFQKYSTIVDCIFGTGFKGEVRGKAADAIKAINASGAFVVSVDINSGLNGDSGMPGHVFGQRPADTPDKTGISENNKTNNKTIENTGISKNDKPDENTGLSDKAEITEKAGATGRNETTGKAENICVRSDITISIGSFKPGHFLNMAKDVMKRKINCDIGITPVERPYYLLEEDDIKPYFKPRPNYSHKGTYGYVALIGGSKRYSGAIRLASMANAAMRESCSKFVETDEICSKFTETGDICRELTETEDVCDPAILANAAMRSGAGVVKIAVANSLCPVVAAQVLESTLFPLSDNDGEIRFVESEIAELISNVKTVAFGMGIGVTGETAKILDYLLDNYRGRLIVDADGLTLLSKISSERILHSKPELILTPHVKEFSRLTEGRDIDESSTPIERAEKFADMHKVVLLLKGPSTIITDGETTYLTDTGCPGMATAGSGDVLSGILAATCAYIPDIQTCAYTPDGQGLKPLTHDAFLKVHNTAVNLRSDGMSGISETAESLSDPVRKLSNSSKLLIATAIGAYINGKAGELAQKKTNSVSMIASDTVSCINEVISGFFTDSGS